MADFFILMPFELRIFSAFSDDVTTDTSMILSFNLSVIWAVADAKEIGSVNMDLH
jgi:hypothetical protein